VAHCLALRGGKAGDIRYDGGLHLALDVLGGALLGVSPDLPDHHDALGLGIGLELFENLDKVRPDYRVAPDPYGRGLTDFPLC
jgi:hypothetical protein